MSLALKKRLESKTDDLSTLVADVAALRRDLAAAMRRARPRLTDGGHDAWDSATEIAGRLGGHASDFYRGAARQGAKTVRVLNGQFRDQPAMSVLAAFAIGLLISRLASSRRD